MDPSMPPPPPRNPNPSSSMPPPPPPKHSSPVPQPEESAVSKPDALAAEAEGRASSSASSSMPPPPALKPAPLAPQPEEADGSANASPSTSESSAEEAGKPSVASSGDTEMAEALAAPAEPQRQPRPRAPYTIPDWSLAPNHPFFLEVLKDGVIFDNLDVASEVFGVSRGGKQEAKDTWWWNDKVQRAIKEKKECFKRLHLDKSATNIEDYKIAKRAAKRAVSVAKGQAYDNLYQRLGTKEGEKDIYRMARIRERKTRDINQIKCVKDGVDRLLETEIEEALKRMKSGKAMGPDGIPHRILQFRNDGKVFLYDLGSTHGSFINKTQIKKKLYTEIHVGDVIRFGQSSRLYIFQGPSELMPPEKDMQKLRDAKIHQDSLDREASLLRAKTQAALSEGISWGMAEDAIEDATEDEADEVTWQTYKGQLTERQEKTRNKILKRMEKIGNMKKEIDAIRVKDISQGGLTQGQQTQIARNEQRISQIMEELDNLEETLNDSIRESLGARSGKAKRSSHKTIFEEEEDVLSDDDEFYDRTKKKSSSQKFGEQKSVETADSLLEKKDSITNDIENKKKFLEEEKHKLAQSDTADPGDDLDAYMSGLSSQLVHDKIAKVQKELSDLQAELDRVVYLLKIADPMGEAARKRDLKPTELKIQASGDKLRPKSDKQIKVAQPTSTEEQQEKIKDSCDKIQTDEPAKLEDGASKNQENGSKPAFTMPKPQWLGDKRIIEPEENFINEEKADAEEPDNFVDYKDRKTILCNSGSGKDLEEAAPGLILRKRKTVDQSAASEADSSSVQSEASAADAVALLLKHKRGLQTSDDMENENEPQASKTKGKKSKQKRVLGPVRPDFLDKGPDYETWVPPEGQTGDGRTALNDRLGY
ncbi:hypothetical protein PR202_ga17185 [Eleusine coracana subsp. coracana]|uniref:FHA domain-containing protein n=1 Tax=Eleusine coracana subsp. coracana TaxID=191504 RepID=A0AAV5CPU9_ELECO|nr:hypothetical protein PR202_ga17185 [Eleusine coracana subsp. coracana]